MHPTARCRSLRAAVVCLSLAAPAHARAEGRAPAESFGVEPDGEHELLVAPPSPFPIRGPRYSLVTIDLFQPLGTQTAAGNMALVLRLFREQGAGQELRLVYHPVPNGTVGERGAEAIWEAQEQRLFWPLCERLYERPELLQQEQEPALLRAAAQLGLEPQRLREALQHQRHRGAVAELWRRDREGTLYPPELWINGRRLMGGLVETQLRDEIERQRERARGLLREGVPLSQLYDRLVAQERERATSLFRRPTPGRGPLSDPPGRPRRLPVDLGDAPTRGPRVAPVTLVLFASLDSFSTRQYAEAIREVMARHPGQLRLSVKHLPSGYPGQQAAWLLSQLQLRAPAEFWRAYDGLVQAVGKRFQLSSRDVPSVLLDLHLRSGELLPNLVPGAAQELLEADRAQARQLGLEAAPALLVNGLLLRGTLTTEGLLGVVERELELGLLGRLCSAPAEAAP